MRHVCLTGAPSRSRSRSANGVAPMEQGVLSPFERLNNIESASQVYKHDHVSGQ